MKIEEWFEENKEIILKAVSMVKWGGVTAKGWVREGKPYDQRPYSQQLEVTARANELKEILLLIRDLKKENK